MKLQLASTGLILAVCAFASSQDTTGDRVVVPARNTTSPRIVKCNLMNAPITVKTYDGKEVIVEEASSQTDRKTPQGMHRLNLSNRGLEVSEEDNVITIRKRLGNSQGVVITVPVETSLRLRTSNGDIHVDGVHGEVEAHTTNNRIIMTHISGTVSADSQNGPIRIGLDRVDASKPLAFSSFNGPIDLTLPPDLKANLTVRTNHAPVYSDFDVLLGGSRAVTEKNGSPDGRFRIRIDNTIRGTINGGGIDLTIRSFNGGVYLRKKK